VSSRCKKSNNRWGWHEMRISVAWCLTEARPPKTGVPEGVIEFKMQHGPEQLAKAFDQMNHANRSGRYQRR